jgi:hypothetical protein
VQRAALFVYLLGLAIITGAILCESEIAVRLGGVGLFAGLLLFGWNIARVFGHFRHPRIKPLSPARPVAV